MQWRITADAREKDHARLLWPIIGNFERAGLRYVAGEAEHFRVLDLNEPAFGRRQFAWDNVQDSA